MSKGILLYILFSIVEWYGMPFHTEMFFLSLSTSTFLNLPTVHHQTTVVNKSCALSFYRSLLNLHADHHYVCTVSWFIHGL
jgi:hypothetical protein